MLTRKIKKNIRHFTFLLKKYMRQRSRYKHKLIDVKCVNEDEHIELIVVIRGIRNHVVHFIPEKILYDDDLLSEFSPCDVRAITYLSFRKYLKYSTASLKITGQVIKFGKTIFEVKSLINNRSDFIESFELYQNHDYLSSLNHYDMINVISTAVQEQAMRDFKIMEKQ